MSSPDRRRTARNEADDNLAAYEAGLARLEARLKAEHPELFDESGEIKSAEVSRIFIERAGGKTELTRTELLSLMRWPNKTPSDATKALPAGSRSR
jgi:hypothetical protein